MNIQQPGKMRIRQGFAARKLHLAGVESNPLREPRGPDKICFDECLKHGSKFPAYRITMRKLQKRYFITSSALSQVMTQNRTHHSNGFHVSVRQSAEALAREGHLSLIKKVVVIFLFSR